MPEMDNPGDQATPLLSTPEPLAGKSWLGLTTQLVVGALFFASACAKGTDLVRFGRQIEVIWGTFGNGANPAWEVVAFLAGVAIVVIEMIIGASFLTRFRIRTVGIAAMAMLGLFALVLVKMMISGGVSDCACFGVFLKRSPALGLFEDVLLAGLVWISVKKSPRAGSGSIPLFAIIFAAGVGLLAIFYYSPPSFAAMRTGFVWRAIESDPVLQPNRKMLVWLLDPNCSKCLDSVSLINRLSKDDRIPPVVALTDATPGRIQEFLWDFEPDFQLVKTTRKELDRIFLPYGSLLLISEGMVKQIWRPGTIPGSPGEIARMIYK